MRQLTAVTSVIAFSLLLTSTAMTQTIPANGYNGTVFVHGFADNGARWRVSRSGAPGMPASPIVAKYSAAVVLGDTVFPSLTYNATIATQAGNLRGWIPATGNYVLIGHSMGGVVARKTHQNSSAGIAGIITIGSPHQGTYVANNRLNYYAYLDMTIGRLRAAGIPLGISAGIAYGASAGAPLGAQAALAAIGAGGGYYLGQQINCAADSVPPGLVPHRPSRGDKRAVERAAIVCRGRDPAARAGHRVDPGEELPHTPPCFPGGPGLQCAGPFAQHWVLCAS